MTGLLQDVGAYGEELLRRCKATMLYCSACYVVTGGAMKEARAAMKEAGVAGA